MSVSPIIPANDTPTADDLWALSYLSRVNWEDGTELKSSFRTAIKYALTASEQRWGMQGKPRRIASGQLQAFGTADVAKLRSSIRRMTKSKYLFPLHSDVSLLDSSATAGDTVLNVDTTYRRLYVGYRVAIVRRTDDPTATTFEVHTIAALTDSTLTLATPLAHNFGFASEVLPLIECQLIFSLRGTIATDDKAQVTVEAVEATGATQLPASETPGSIPSGFGQYGDYPILSAAEDFGGQIENGVAMYGDFSESGIGNYPTIYGPRASETFSLPVLATNRYEAWKIIRFFDSRAGALHPFYCISPLTEYTVKSIAGTSVTVEATGLESDWAFRPFIGIIDADGVRYVRAVTFVERVGEEDLITLHTEIVGLTLGNIARATTAWLVRLTSDELSEKWMTNSVMQTTLSMREVLNEKPIVVSNLEVATSSDLVGAAATPCGAEATYYRALDCDNDQTNIYIQNTGQSLPFEFTNLDDNRCYKIPLGAVPVPLPAPTDGVGGDDGGTTPPPPGSAGEGMTATAYPGFVVVHAGPTLDAMDDEDVPFTAFEWEFVELGVTVSDVFTAAANTAGMSGDLTINMYANGVLHDTLTITPVDEPATAVTVSNKADFVTEAAVGNQVVYVDTDILDFDAPVNVAANTVICGVVSPTSTAKTRKLVWNGPYSGQYLLNFTGGGITVRNFQYGVGFKYPGNSSAPNFVDPNSNSGVCVRHIDIDFAGTVVQGNGSPSDVWINDISADVDALQRYMAWVQGPNWIIEGCTIQNSVLEHCVRGEEWERLALLNNVLRNKATAQSGVPGDIVKTAFRSQHGKDLSLKGNTFEGYVSLHPLEGADGIGDYPDYATIKLSRFRVVDNIHIHPANTQTEVGHRAEYGFIRVAAGSSVVNQELIKVYGKSPEGLGYPVDTTHFITIDLANIPQASNKPNKIYIDTVAQDDVTIWNNGGASILAQVTATAGPTVPTAIVQGPCCAGYRQASLFCGGALAPVWIPVKAINSFPFYFKYLGVCYVITNVSPFNKTPPGTIPGAWVRLTAAQLGALCDCSGPGDGDCVGCIPGQRYAIWEENRFCPGDTPGEITLYKKGCAHAISFPNAAKLVCRGDGQGALSLTVRYLVLIDGDCNPGEEQDFDPGSPPEPMSQAAFLTLLYNVAMSAEPPMPECSTCNGYPCIEVSCTEGNKTVRSLSIDIDLNQEFVDLPSEYNGTQTFTPDEIYESDPPYCNNWSAKKIIKDAFLGNGGAGGDYGFNAPYNATLRKVLYFNVVDGSIWSGTGRTEFFQPLPELEPPQEFFEEDGAWFIFTPDPEGDYTHEGVQGWRSYYGPSGDSLEGQDGTWIPAHINGDGEGGSGIDFEYFIFGSSTPSNVCPERSYQITGDDNGGSSENYYMLGAFGSPSFREENLITVDMSLDDPCCT